MAEEAAPAPTAVKQKNRTLAVPPTRDHATRSPVRFRRVGGAVFCLTAGKPSQTPKVLFTDRERSRAASAAVTRPFPAGRVARGRAPPGWWSVGVVLEGDADPGAHVLRPQLQEGRVAAEVEDLAGELGDEAVGAPAA